MHSPSHTTGGEPPIIGNNEEEAVWRCYEEKRLRRRLLSSTSAIPEEILCYLDWLQAGREVRPMRAIGKWIAA